MSNLSINHLAYSYNDNPVLDNLSLTVDSNEIVCLLGASGCGKTTTLKAIAGLIKPQSGQITIADNRVNDKALFVAPQHRNIGMMFQDYALFPHLTVEQNVAFGLHGSTNTAKVQRVTEMLELVRLGAFAKRYPHQLSGGQQQRVAIARALAYKPNLLLLDEPFSNIDNQVRFELINEIRSIIKDQQVSAIFVTHSKEEAFAFADKLAIMEQGKIVQLGTPEQLYQKPNSKGVAAFLSDGIFIGAQTENGKTFTTDMGTITSSETITHMTGLAVVKGEVYLKPQYLSITACENGLGQFISSRFVGNRYMSRIKLAGQELEVPCPEQPSFTNGQRLAIDVKPHIVNFFINSSH